MHVGVITPYFRETLDVLRNCHDSVRKQTHPCEHFMVADGFPQTEISNWAVQHIVLAKSHADAGNTPRAIGSLSAMNQDFDAIAYLDADNWYYPNHLEAMIKLHQQTGEAVCTASRTIHRLDGSLIGADGEYDKYNLVDTSCFFFTRPAFRLLPAWAMMPRQLRFRFAIGSCAISSDFLLCLVPIIRNRPWRSGRITHITIEPSARRRRLGPRPAMMRRRPGNGGPPCPRRGKIIGTVRWV